MTSKITIIVEEHEGIPEPFVAQIEGAPGMVVQGTSLIDSLEQLVCSLKAAESHKKNHE